MAISPFLKIWILLPLVLLVCCGKDDDATFDADAKTVGPSVEANGTAVGPSASPGPPAESRNPGEDPGVLSRTLPRGVVGVSSKSREGRTVLTTGIVIDLPGGESGRSYVASLRPREMRGGALTRVSGASQGDANRWRGSSSIAFDAVSGLEILSVPRHDDDRSLLLETGAFSAATKADMIRVVPDDGEPNPERIAFSKLEAEWIPLKARMTRFEQLTSERRRKRPVPPEFEAPYFLTDAELEEHRKTQERITEIEDKVEALGFRGIGDQVLPDELAVSRSEIEVTPPEPSNGQFAYVPGEGGEAEGCAVFGEDDRWLGFVGRPQDEADASILLPVSSLVELIDGAVLDTAISFNLPTQLNSPKITVHLTCRFLPGVNRFRDVGLLVIRASQVTGDVENGGLLLAEGDALRRNLRPARVQSGSLAFVQREVGTTLPLETGTTAFSGQIICSRVDGAYEGLEPFHFTVDYEKGRSTVSWPEENPYTLAGGTSESVSDGLKLSPPRIVEANGGPIASIISGGRGRFLLFSTGTGEEAGIRILDVDEEIWLEGELPKLKEGSLMAANANSLFVYDDGDRRIRRFNLPQLDLVESSPPMNERLTAMTAPTCSVDAPLLVVGTHAAWFIDPQSLSHTGDAIVRQGSQGFSEVRQGVFLPEHQRWTHHVARASGDGGIYAIRQAHVGEAGGEKVFHLLSRRPVGFDIRVTSAEYRLGYRSDRLYAENHVASPGRFEVVQTPKSTGTMTLIPSIDTDLYLLLSMDRAAFPPEPLRGEIHQTSGTEPVALRTFHSLIEMNDAFVTEVATRTIAGPPFQRVWFLPAREKLVTIPDATSVYIRSLEWMEMEEMQLALRSAPRTWVKRGDNYEFQLSAFTAPSITAEMVAGPEEARLSPGGRLQWDVPLDHAEDAASFEIHVNDGAKKAVSSFDLRIVGSKPTTVQRLGGETTRTLNEEQLFLKGRFDRIDSAGDGRLLVGFSRQSRLMVVVDVATRKEVASVRLPASEVRFVANRHDVFVYYVHLRMIERRSLGDLSRSGVWDFPDSEHLFTFGIGANSSESPLFLGFRGDKPQTVQYVSIDPRTFEVLGRISRPHRSSDYLTLDSQGFIPAAMEPGGRTALLESLVIDNPVTADGFHHLANRSDGKHGRLGPEGNLVFSKGEIYDRQADRVHKDLAHFPTPDPAGDYFWTVSTRGKRMPFKLILHATASREPLLEFSGFSEFDGFIDFSGSDELYEAVRQRVHFLPALNTIASLSAAGDTLIFRGIDFRSVYNELR